LLEEQPKPHTIERAAKSPTILVFSFISFPPEKHLFY
jgi:hypothetical protein